MGSHSYGALISVSSAEKLVPLKISVNNVKKVLRIQRCHTLMTNVNVADVYVTDCSRELPHRRSKLFMKLNLQLAFHLLEFSLVGCTHIHFLKSECMKTIIAKLAAGVKGDRSLFLIHKPFIIGETLSQSSLND